MVFRTNAESGKFNGSGEKPSLKYTSVAVKPAVVLWTPNSYPRFTYPRMYIQLCWRTHDFQDISRERGDKKEVHHGTNNCSSILRSKL
jgi:hypothetical protein